jgi:uncharacterized membrane protein
MRRTTWVVAVGAALAVLPGPTVFAETNSQQEKMKTCNADAKAKNLSGDERKSFMKTCLSDQPAAPAKTNSQQEKMKSCNKEATGKGLKGADRKSFMSTCLKGSGSEASK